MEPTPEVQPEPVAAPTADEQGVDVTPEAQPQDDPSAEPVPETAQPEPTPETAEPEPEPEPTIEEQFRAALARWIDAASHDHVEQRVRELGRKFLGLDE